MSSTVTKKNNLKGAINFVQVFFHFYKLKSNYDVQLQSLHPKSSLSTKTVLLWLYALYISSTAKLASNMKKNKVEYPSYSFYDFLCACYFNIETKV